VATIGRVERIERSIRKVEGFDVRLLHPNGRDVRGDKQGLPPYPYLRAAKDGITVAQWRDTRFNASYPGYSVLVVDADGNRAHGGTQLATVRASYFSETRS
jgi:hypothetical protein